MKLKTRSLKNIMVSLKYLEVFVGENTRKLKLNLEKIGIFKPTFLALRKMDMKVMILFLQEKI